MLIFLFNQKTAYEMIISDWSSDVCSSDLTTALDVTVEAGSVELIADISRQFGTAQIFISHNLGLVRETCDRICVMYSGEAVETGTIDDVFNHMRHPYTRGLFGAIPLPSADKNQRPLVAIPGQLPLPHQRPAGCNFGPRCEHFRDGVCAPEPVAMREVPGSSQPQWSRCNRFEEIDWDAPPGAGKLNEPIERGEPGLIVHGMRTRWEEPRVGKEGGSK